MMDIEIEDRVADLREDLGARAAGYWRVEPGRLLLRAFVPAPDLDAEVARGFAEATRSIATDRRDLGVVQAQSGGPPVVSVAAELPEETGSGRWLRAFGAACSIAVPLADREGETVAVLSVALPEIPGDRDSVAEQIRRVGRAILGS